MPSPLSRWLRLWFTFESGVGRREYLLSGLALAALKYAGDALMVWYASGRFWRPISSRSRKPSVVMRPVFTPRCWIRALVATVVPWPK